jgi:hypothetical protein
MRLDKLKKAVDKKFGLDIATRSRKRKYVYARKVFCKLARETGATFQAIGNEINTKHDLVLFHCNTIDVIEYQYKDKHDELIDELKLVFSKPFTKKEKPKPKPKKQIAKTNTSETLKRIKCITDVISEWDIETVQEFKQTRLDPFNASLKHRVKPKPILEVKGAKINKKVKNPVLC